MNVLHRKISLVFAAVTLALVGCNSNPHPQMALDTIRISSDTTSMVADTMRVNDTAKIDTTHATLLPMAKAIDPTRLAQFLPKMPNWTPSGDLQKEIQVRDTFNKSRAAQTYTQGSKKVTIEINDFAYVPSLYDPWQKYKNTYIDDNNNARTETTTIAGYRAVQTMQKHEPQGQVTIFPGNRYVVTILEDGADNINEVRRIGESVDLKGLESLQ